MSDRIELFRFVRDSEVWTYTSGDTAITYNAEVYQPVPLKRDSIESKNEISKANLNISLDILDGLSQTVLNSFTEKVLGLTVFVQENLITGIIWKGRLTSHQPGGHTLKLAFESIFTSLRRPGLRARYQKTCRHVLYSGGCNLDPETFAVAGLATDVSEAVITVTEAGLQADGWYIGGMLRDPNGILGFIINHVGTLITLQRPVDSLTQAWIDSGFTSVAVTLYPGCDRLRSTCETKFDNLNNYGGFPWIPSKNPMGGSSII